MSRSPQFEAGKSKAAVSALRILLIEDNPGDAALIRYILGESAVPHSITVVYDGASAMEILEGINARGNSRPDLILLDINLPKYSGFQILKTIRANPALDSTIVNMLTSSRLEDDINVAYHGGANAYTWKQSDFERACDELTRMFRYWSTFQSNTM